MKPSCIELDELLEGNPTWPQVVEWFKAGEFYQEHYLIKAIKKHLRTPQQKATMDKLDMSIEDMLNGRTSGNAMWDAEQKIFDEWNSKLGYKHFGS